MMILDLLRDDHAVQRVLLDALDRNVGYPAAERKQRFDTLRADMHCHGEAEQQIFYPALLERLPDRTEIVRAFQEHSGMETMLVALDRRDVVSPSWQHGLRRLRARAEHHMRVEENETFPQVEEAFDQSELEDMGRRFILCKHAVRLGEDDPANTLEVGFARPPED